MNTDTPDLLRSFRISVQEADDETETRVLQRVTAERVRQRRHSAPRSLGVAASLGVGVAAAAVLALATPWQRGPASVPAADAARVLRGTLAVITPRPGWVFHERVQLDEVVPGTSKRRSGSRELWLVNGPPHTYRQVSTNNGFDGTFETGGTAGSTTGYVYDAKTATLYRTPLGGRLRVASQLASASWRSSIARDIRAKRAKVVGRSVVDGREAYEIEWFLAQFPLKLYVDASTYAPIEIVFPGLEYLDGHWWYAREHFTAYDYMRPTKTNLALADVGASHPSARRATSSEIPTALRAQLNPPAQPSNGR